MQHYLDVAIYSKPYVRGVVFEELSVAPPLLRGVCPFVEPCHDEEPSSYRAGSVSCPFLCRSVTGNSFATRPATIAATGQREGRPRVFFGICDWVSRFNCNRKCWRLAPRFATLGHGHFVIMAVARPGYFVCPQIECWRLLTSHNAIVPNRTINQLTKVTRKYFSIF